MAAVATKLLLSIMVYASSYLHVERGAAKSTGSISLFLELFASFR